MTAIIAMFIYLFMLMYVMCIFNFYDMIHHIKLKIANLEIKLVLIYSTNHLAHVLVFKRAHSMSGLLVHWASAKAH